MNSIANLNEEDFEKIKKVWFSHYPLIYYKLNRIKNIDFTFKNEKIRTFYENIDLNCSIEEFNYLFTSQLSDLADDVLKLKLTFEDIVELSKTFFKINYILRQELIDSRMIYLETAYKNRSLQGYSTKEQIVYWRHDGWWNCYYGKVQDTDGKKFALEKDRDFDKNSYKKPWFIKRGLNLMYRLAESGEVSEAIQVGKRYLKYVKKNTIFNSKNEIKEKNIFLKIGFLHKRLSWQHYLQAHMNITMFLYRAETNEKKKKRILKKIYKLNNVNKIYFNNALRNLILDKDLKRISLYVRPQHLLRLVEIRVDLYQYIKSKKKKERILEEIYKLLKDFLELMNKGYYIHFYLNSHILYEFYFTLFYVLEKIYNIDIQNY